MAKARERNFEWHYGDSFDDFLLRFTDKSGNPYSLAGYSARMDIKVAPDDDTAALSLTTSANDGLTLDTSAGTLLASASFAKMLSGSLDVGVKYYYQVQIQNTTTRRTVLTGRFITLDDIAEN